MKIVITGAPKEFIDDIIYMFSKECKVGSVRYDLRYTKLVVTRERRKKKKR